MHLITQLFRRLVAFAVHRPVMVLVGAGLLAGVSMWFALDLRIDTDFARLLPSEDPYVEQLNKLRDEVGAESEAAVAVTSPDFESTKSFTDALTPAVMALVNEKTGRPLLGRVDYRRDTRFMRANALYFATNAELDELENELDTQVKAAQTAMAVFLPGFVAPPADVSNTRVPDTTRMISVEESIAEIIPDDIPVSPDSTTIVVRFYPAGSQTDIGFIRDLYTRLDEVVVGMNPASFHPEMNVTIAGRLLRQQIEVESITKDVASSFGGGVSAVILLITLYFFFKTYRARAGGRWSSRIFLSELARMPVTALIIAIPLLISLSWTFGLAQLVFGSLNLMTSTLVLVLFGLGVDFGIHFYARYTEFRGAGLDPKAAALATFDRNGPAIGVSALTTAVSLFVLILADFQGFSQFGAIAGTGILAAAFAMLVILPAVLTLFERWGILHLEAFGPVVEREWKPWQFPAARAVLVTSLVFCAIALAFLPRVSFEYRFGELEPTYEEYEKRAAEIAKVYPSNRKRNPAFILVDNTEEAAEVLESLQASIDADTLSPTVLGIESLQERFPDTPLTTTRRLDRLREIREKLDHPILRSSKADLITRIRAAAQTTVPVPLDSVPDYIKTRFQTLSGQFGKFVSIYPSVGLSDGRMSMEFARDVGEVITRSGKKFYAASTSIIGARMLSLMMRESPLMIGVTFLAVLALMFLVFQSLRWTILAMMPLAVGLLWMLGLMELLELKLNFYNLIALPAVIGVGNDAGVHLVFRYREEGKGSLRRVLASTGQHVAVGSLTTMIGFAWWLRSAHPGLQSIGALAVLGIGCVLAASLLFLPAVIQWMESRGTLKEQPLAALDQS